MNKGSDTYEMLMWDVITNAHRYVPKEGDHVLDLGAHFGMFSLYCASRGCQVTAYEPFSESFKELEHTARVADEIGMGKICTSNCAISPKGGPIHLWRQEDKPSSVWSIRPIPPDLRNVHLISVPSVTLSHALKPLNEDIFWMWNCVKVDIEGAEADVFSTVTAEDLSRVRFLTMEIHNELISLEDRREMVEYLTWAFPCNAKIFAKVDGKPTEDVCTLLCWR